MNPVTPLRILLVDDNFDNIEVLKARAEAAWPRRLSRRVEAVAVLDGYSALDELKSGRFDLIITDVVMGGLDGHELARRIRGGEHIIGPHSTPSSVPIIKLSARNSREERMLEDRSMFFVSRPLDFHELEGRIQELLGPK